MKKKGNRSKKHHYLPIHYQKGFQNDFGKIFVYDKNAERIIRNVNPRTFFAENELNTIDFGGKKHDFIEEKIYNFIDNHSAEQFQKIRASNWAQEDSISAFDRIGFGWTLCNLFWRIPSSEANLLRLRNQESFDNIETESFSFQNNFHSGLEEDFSKYLRSKDDLRPISKLIYALHSFNNGEVKNIASRWNIFHLLENDRLVTGDNPFARKRENLVYGDLLGEFIFPISGNKLIVITNEPPSFIDEVLLLYINLMILHQSERFICMADAENLKKVVGIYNDFRKEGIHHNIRNFLFEHLAEISKFNSIEEYSRNRNGI